MLSPHYLWPKRLQSENGVMRTCTSLERTSFLPSKACPQPPPGFQTSVDFEHALPSAIRCLPAPSPPAHLSVAPLGPSWIRFHRILDAHTGASHCHQNWLFTCLFPQQTESHLKAGTVLYSLFHPQYPSILFPIVLQQTITNVVTSKQHNSINLVKEVAI